MGENRIKAILSESLVIALVELWSRDPSLAVSASRNIWRQSFDERSEPTLRTSSTNLYSILASNLLPAISKTCDVWRGSRRYLFLLDSEVKIFDNKNQFTNLKKGFIVFLHSEFVYKFEILIYI